MAPRKPLNIIFLSLFLLVALSGVLTGCASNSSTGNTNTSLMAPLEQMPTEVQESPRVVQEAYQFAIANPDILKQLPCHCGCGDMGHTSNYSCYVQDVSNGGEVTYDNHALGCSICVDITQDAMRLINEGKTLPEIRSYVDETYSQYGPSNIPAGQ